MRAPARVVAARVWSRRALPWFRFRKNGERGDAVVLHAVLFGEVEWEFNDSQGGRTFVIRSSRLGRNWRHNCRDEIFDV